MKVILHLLLSIDIMSFYVYSEGEFSIPISPEWVHVDRSQMREIVQEVTSEDNIESIRKEYAEELQELQDPTVEIAGLKYVAWLRQHEIDREIFDLFLQHIDRNETQGMMVSIICGVIHAIGYQHDVRYYWRHVEEPGWGKVASHHCITGAQGDIRGDCIGPLDAVPRETREHRSFFNRLFPCIFS